jgi:Methylase involved in ubiquinone/menaquinone biosynthesis
MTAQIAHRISPRDASPLTAAEEARLTWLTQSVLSNRFLPAPPPENVFVGDGDYRAIGAEFLGHFVRLGGLKPSDRVLDIGCGIGRMAVPLTQYLDSDAVYEGIDPVGEGIAWCTKTISRGRGHRLVHEDDPPRLSQFPLLPPRRGASSLQPRGAARR